MKIDLKEKKKQLKAQFRNQLIILNSHWKYVAKIKKK